MAYPPDPVRIRAESPPDTIENPKGKKDRGETGDAPVKKSGGGRFGEDKDAVEASRSAAEARRRYAEARKDTGTTAAEGLRRAAQSQLEIALGPKSVPAAARTAAAKAYSDLVVAAEEAEARSASKVGEVDWAAMSEQRRTLVRTVLEATEEDIEKMSISLREEEERAPQAQGQESVGDDPTPPA